MKLVHFTLAFIFLVISSFSAFSQTGKVRISGQISDAATKEGLFGASVVIEGTTTGAQTDFEGKYKIDIPANQALKLVFRSMGYKTKVLPLKAIPEGEKRILDISLEEEAKQQKEVTITAVRRKDTEVSMITDLKKADVVVNGVSAQQIVKTQDRDAAQVMSRVPGVTVVDNRFVMIRGVNERYNAVMINNAISPGTEVDTRSFSFDLIASNMIERMMVYKSGSASLPGEFAGGVVKIDTRNTFGEDFFQVNVGTSLRPSTTLAAGTRSEGSSTDFLGFDNGTRTLPAHFPSTETFQNLSAAQQLQYTRQLNDNFGNQSYTIRPDLRLGFSMGKRWNLANRQLSTVSSLTYNSTFQNQQTSRFRYASWDAATQKSQDTLFQYSDRSSNQNVRISANSNWMLKSEKSRLELKTLFNQIGDNETVIRTGKIADRSGDEFRNYSYNYLSRSLLSSQLLGTHTLSEKTELSWVASYSFTNRSQPDYRRIRTVKAENSVDPFQLVPAAGSGGLDETGRFYSQLREHVGMVSAQVETRFRVSWDSSRAAFKAGTYQEFKQRSFDARFFAYLLKNPGQNQALLSQPLSQIFSAENLSTTRFVLEEGTRPQDSYQASNFLSAGFAEVMVPVRQFRFNLGVRPEYNVQTMESATSSGKVAVKNPILSPLLFFNGSVNIWKDLVGRIAYCNTVNRPEFRELAPFVYYDFNLDANFVGNPDLKVASIHNFDARMEWYPSAGELISLGGFYKYFLNPIETKVSPVGLSPQFTYSNAESAQNYGAELEVRKALGNAAGNRLMDRLFLVCNAAWIHSRVDLGVVGSQERIRTLQGQSPYVINGGLFYSTENSKLSFTALYNVYGKRIFMVGDALFPTIYELPRHIVDLTANYQLSKKVNLRFALNDLLNYQSRFVQDSNRDGKINGKDELISRFRRGSYLSFSAQIQL